MGLKSCGGLADPVPMLDLHQPLTAVSLLLAVANCALLVACLRLPSPVRAQARRTR